MGKCALIVDNSRTSRAVLQRILETHDLMVDTAVSAESALDYLTENRPDVIEWGINRSGSYPLGELALEDARVADFEELGAHLQVNGTPSPIRTTGSRLHCNRMLLHRNAPVVPNDSVHRR